MPKPIHELENKYPSEHEVRIASRQEMVPECDTTTYRGFHLNRLLTHNTGRLSVVLRKEWFTSF